MSNIHNEKQLEEIQAYVLEQDRKGLLENDIRDISIMYNLHADDDRDAILEHIEESIFYEQSIGVLI